MNGNVKNIEFGFVRVLKCESDRFLVDLNGESVYCFARHGDKKSDIVAGDFVFVEEANGARVIKSVKKRKNSLIRPQIANIDQIIILAAPLPKIDYFLLDKLIINARKQDLRVVLCLNKTDISDEDLASLTNQYSVCVDKIICVSAINDQTEPLKQELESRLSCFAGQSAVGKSSVINSLLKTDRQTTGELSEKIQRGKNTTTKAEIIRLKKNTLIADTPGFTSLDIHDIPFEELPLYYGEYVELSDNCKYRMCSHTTEPDCAVKNAVESGALSKERHNRYLIMYNDLKQADKFKYR